MTYIDKIKEVKHLIANGDTHLGYRKMLDIVLDTQKPEFFKKVIEIEKFKESHDDDQSEWLERVNQLLDELSNIEVQIAEPKLLLQADNITKRYGRGSFELGPVSISIYSGDLIGLVGENGNGKTTLLRMLAKDISIDTGNVDVSFSGNQEQLYDIRTQLTYIPQRTPTWYGSLQDNLKYAAAHYGVHGELNELIVHMMIIRFGLWRYRFFKWSELSSGYKMRFELARTFLRSPRILLLDEPLANLDVLAQQLILEDLKNLSKSIANPIGIILSSQQLFEVEKVSDAVLFLKNGKPTHLNETFDQLSKTAVVEIESSNSREDIQNALNNIPDLHIRYNGGTYQIKFSANTPINDLIKTLIENQIKIHYFRDISMSTKRLFV